MPAAPPGARQAVDLCFLTGRSGVGRVDATGRMLGTATAGEEVLSVEADVEAIATWRGGFPVLPGWRLR